VKAKLRVTKNKKLFKNISASALTTILITGFNLLSVPIFLRFWGVQKYGEWVALNALASYFQMADAGLTSATANSITLAHATGDNKRLSTLLSNNIVFVSCVFLGLMGLVLALGTFNIFTAILRPEAISESDINTAIMLLCLQVFLGTMNNLLSGLYRAADAYAVSTMIDNGIRALEYITIVGGVLSDWSIKDVLLAVVFVKLFGLAFKHKHSTKILPCRISLKALNRQELVQSIRPSLSFLMFPVSNSLIYQGPVLVANYFLGGSAVVLFTTMRSMASFTRSITDILQRSVWPEFTLLYAKSDFPRIRSLHHGVILWSSVLIAIASTSLFLAGSFVFAAWTGLPDWNGPLFALLLLSVQTNALWSSASILLQATNNNGELSVLVAISAVLIFLVSWAIVAASGDLTLLPVATIIGDLALLYPVIRRAEAIINPSSRAV
jgi:O-antigen/teichoic acid export membrane protein